MNVRPSSREDDMAMTEFDCPWCASPMAPVDAMSPRDGSVACPTCSIVVEFAPDPIEVPIALAA